MNRASPSPPRPIVHSTLWNLLGQAVPLGAAIVAIPFLVKGLGTDRFGILTLAWVVIGYFSLFDFGMGRALTKLVSQELAAGRDEGVPKLVWGAFLSMGVLSIVATLVMMIASPWLVQHALKIPLALRDETRGAFDVLALCIPVVIFTTGLRGILEAHMQFALTNTIRVPLGLFMFIGPMGVMPFTHSLVVIVAVLAVARLAAAIVHWFLCLRIMPSLRHVHWPSWSDIRPLVNLGGWMTLTNVVSPLMVSVDRFIISALISVAAVAYYTTPYEAVTKLLVVPVAISGVLFPAFSATHERDPNATARLFERGTKFVLCCLFPVSLIVATFAHALMHLWLGPEFADKGTGVLQWLTLGVVVNGLAVVPFTLLQAIGRPDLTGKLQVVELPLYLAAVTWLIHHLGIEGAAIAWSGRVTLDAILLFVFAGHVFRECRAAIWRVGVPAATAIALLPCAAALPNIALKTAFLAVVLPLSGISAWLWVLMPADRVLITGWLRLRLRPPAT